MSLEQLEHCIGRFRGMAAGWTAETTIDAMRADLEAMFAGCPELPGATVAARDAGCPAEWVAAPGAESRHVVLCLHGGGFSTGSARAHRSFGGFLSRACDAQVVTIDYRLVPEHRYPAALDDAAAAYRWLRGRGFAASCIALCGDSAGGGLALATLMRLRDERERLPGCAVLLSPWTDMRCRSDSYLRNCDIDPIATREMAMAMGLAYVGEDGDLDDPLASPLLGDLHGLPPILIQLGTREIFFDEAQNLADRIGAAGGHATVESWPGMIHQFQLHVGRLDEAEEAIDAVGRFVRRHWAG